MAVGIFGSGFGIYGYLPAFAQLGYEVVTLERYRTIISERSELSQYRGCISYLDSELDVLNNSTYIVVARDPKSQVTLVEKYLPKLIPKKHVFFEKPLTHSLKIRTAFIRKLEEVGLSFSVAYLFLYSEWFQKILIQESGDFDLTWNITKPVAEWKRVNENGGGILNYYLLHLFPCLDQLSLNLDFENCSLSQSDSLLKAYGKISLAVSVKVSDHYPNFILRSRSSVLSPALYNAQTPFGSSSLSGEPDTRIPYLQSYILDQLSRPDSRTESVSTERSIHQKSLRLLGEI